MTQVVIGIVRWNNRYLLGQRKENDVYGGLYEFPGGEMHSNESKQDCLVRELKEEMNVTIKNIEYFHSYDFNDNNINIIFHCFLCEYKGGTVRLTEHICYKWLKIDEINKYKLVPIDKIILDELIKKNK